MPVREYSAEERAAGRRRLEVSLFLTVLLPSTAFALADGAMFFVAITALAVALHVLAAWRRREIHAQRVVLNGGVIVVGAILVWRFLSARDDLLIALGQYVILIQVCKLFERKSNRDYVQMLVMSLLLMLAAAMMTQELWFALLGLLYAALLCYTGMVFTVNRNLKAGFEQLARARRTGLASPSPRAPQAWPRGVLASRLAVVLVAVLATGVLVFLIAPRGAGGYPALRRMRRQTSVGFRGTVRLGEARDIYRSDRVVMRARFVGADGRPLREGPPAYLRGRVFDRYAESCWSKPVRHVRRRPPGAGDFVERSLQKAIRQEVSMGASLAPVAFAAHPAIRVVSRNAAVQPLNDLEYDLKPHARSDRPIRYTAYVLRRPLTWGQCRQLAELSGYRGRWPRRRGTVAPRVTALARGWCADLLARRPASRDPREREAADLRIARRLAERLRQSYPYSLDLTDADPDRDGVEDFLFHLKRGHCEYFASALTVMCQALGVEARLATGFRPSEYDDATGEYTVRQRDAHAWTEVYTSATDWEVVDATPAERFASPERSQWSRWWAGATDWYRRWEFAWFETVIGYDDEARRRLARGARSSLHAAWRAAGRAAERVAYGLVELFAHGRVDPAAVSFLTAVGRTAAAAACLLALRRRRAARRRAARARPGPAPPAFVIELLALLRRHGLAGRSDQTPRELAAEAARRLHLPHEKLQSLVSLYYRIRWARRPAGADELRRAMGQVRRLGEMLST